MAQKQQHWLTRRETVRKLWIVFVVVLAATVVGGFFVKGHPYFGVDDNQYGFYAWFGLLSCVAMVLVAKALGFAIKRPDDYYDD